MLAAAPAAPVAVAGSAAAPAAVAAPAAAAAPAVPAGSGPGAGQLAFVGAFEAADLEGRKIAELHSLELPVWPAQSEWKR